MRILQLSSARSFGGGERHLADLANSLARRGHDVFAALRPDSPLREVLTELPAQNVFSISLRNALDLKSALNLARIIRDHRIEIIHAHLARDYPLAALAAKRNPTCGLVMTRHVLFPLNRLHRVTFSRVDRVIAVSRAVEQALLKQKLFPASRIRVVPNGVNFERIDAELHQADRNVIRERWGIPQDAPLVGTLGDLKRAKGHEDFLQAAALVSRRTANAYFVIVGEDNTKRGEYRVFLEKLAKTLHLTERVRFVGWVAGTPQLYAASDAYVSASHTESFGLAIVEALSCGLPVVATATEGAQEIIQNDETGMLVPVKDPKALADAIIKLISDQSERVELGRRARASVRERYGLERMVEETERVYDEISRSE